MGKKLPPKQLELCQGIDEILWRDWDPIGINASPEVRDEYHAYLPTAFKLVMENRGAEEIARYLCDIVQENIGPKSTISANMDVAQKMIQLKKSIGI